MIISLRIWVRPCYLNCSAFMKGWKVGAQLSAATKEEVTVERMDRTLRAIYQETISSLQADHDYG